MVNLLKWILFLSVWVSSQIVEIKSTTYDYLAVKLGKTLYEKSTPYVACQIAVTGVSAEIGFRQNSVVYKHKTVTNHLFFGGVEQVWFDPVFDLVGTNYFVGYRYNIFGMINELKFRSDFEKFGASYGLGLGF